MRLFTYNITIVLCYVQNAFGAYSENTRPVVKKAYPPLRYTNPTNTQVTPPPASTPMKEPEVNASPSDSDSFSLVRSLRYLHSTSGDDNSSTNRPRYYKNVGSWKKTICTTGSDKEKDSEERPKNSETYNPKKHLSTKKVRFSDGLKKNEDNIERSQYFLTFRSPNLSAQGTNKRADVINVPSLGTSSSSEIANAATKDSYNRFLSDNNNKLKEGNSVSKDLYSKNQYSTTPKKDKPVERVADMKTQLDDLMKKILTKKDFISVTDFSTLLNCHSAIQECVESAMPFLALYVEDILEDDNILSCIEELVESLSNLLAMEVSADSSLPSEFCYKLITLKENSSSRRDIIRKQWHVSRTSS
ncbi:hypothetical protein THOM_3289 [Trachipleistophora hominis]|uniref:Uncharacterized protein n=1 Tax=Trachipleistophora hominis TaxID=72359 RepID=L7JRA7_TRAHO|nr:hypothetical protein THOM_3289 [Trachipleistophora hominis]